MGIWQRGSFHILHSYKSQIRQHSTQDQIYHAGRRYTPAHLLNHKFTIRCTNLDLLTSLPRSSVFVPCGSFNCSNHREFKQERARRPKSRMMQCRDFRFSRLFLLISQHWRGCRLLIGRSGRRGRRHRRVVLFLCRRHCAVGADPPRHLLAERKRRVT